MMIVVRPQQTSLQGLGTLGAIDPLGAKVTIPGFGIRVSARDILVILCNSGKLNKTLCELIKLKPAEACKQLVAQGDAWLTSQLESVIKNMINKTMSLVDCKASNWKDIVKSSFTVSFNSEGLSVDFDASALIQSTICAAVNKTISLSFKPVVNLLVKNLKDGCAKLGSSTSSAPAGASTAYTAPTSSSGGGLFTRATTKILNSSTTQESSSTQQPKAVYSVMTAPKSKMDNTALAWGGVGVVLIGVTWFALSRRKS